MFDYLDYYTHSTTYSLDDTTHVDRSEGTANSA